MAFTLENLSSIEGTIEVIVSKDDALDDVSPEVFSEYLQTLDESKLKFKEGKEPCRWVLKRRIDYKKQKWLENQKVKFEGGEQNFQPGYIGEEIRACLIDLKYPDYVPEAKRIVIKKQGDGLVDEKLMEQLLPTGIITELFIARTKAMSDEASAPPRK